MCFLNLFLGAYTVVLCLNVARQINMNENQNYEAGRMIGGIGSLLKSRDFALLWSGQLASRFSDAIASMALIWLALEMSGSPLIMSAVLLCNMLPSLLFTIPAGAFVDRHSRKRIMVFSSCGRALLTLGFFLLCFSGKVELWHLYLITFVDSTVECFFGPALGAMVPRTVDGGRLLSANSAMSMTASISQMVGMGAGGVMIGFIGVPAAFLIDSFTYLASAVSVMFIRIKEDTTYSKETNRLRDIKDGFRFVAKKRVLLTAFFVAMILNFGAGALNVIIPVLSDTLSFGAEGYGYILASFSAGSLIGAVVLGSVGSSRDISAEMLMKTMPGVWALVFLCAPFFRPFFHMRSSSW